MSMLVPALGSLLVGVPVYLVLIAGLVLAAVKWKSCRKAAALAVGGLGLMLVASIFGSVVGSALPLYLRKSGMSYKEISGTLLTVAVVRSLFAAVAWGLVVAAIFAERPTAAT